jgi:hypothetical protein
MMRQLVGVVFGVALLTSPAQAQTPSFSRLLDGSNRYAMREWYPHRSAGGVVEQDIRPAADQVFALAAGVTTGRHSSATKRRRIRAIETLMRELSRDYGHWGNHWQSALWASRLGYAVLLLRDDLSKAARAGVRRVVVREANRFIGYEVPYYRRGDLILSPGDTKAEENAWNAKVLAAALALVPRHPNAAAWARKNRELLVSALARPQDTHGRYARLLRGGSNVNSDFTLTNHGIREHPDYAASALGTGLQAIPALLAGRPIPAEAFLNHRGIYRRLTRSYEPSGTIRRSWTDPLVDSRPPFAFALVDLQAHLVGYGGVEAPRWYRRHIAEALAPRRKWVSPYGEAWNQGVLAAAAAYAVLLEQLASRTEPL